MAKIIEPPVLMSRILTFTLAASVVIVGVLLVTLAKMIPLERPEVFFLSTPTISTNVHIEPLVPDSGNKVALEKYKEGFVRQYIIARNTLRHNPNMTRNNWKKIIRPWSSGKILNDFTKTQIYQDYLNDKVPPFTCDVHFSDIIDTDENTFNVKFTWLCENNDGQVEGKNYKIQIKIESDLDKNLSGILNNTDKLRENPLGIQVVQYKIMDGKEDPLDSDVMFGKVF